MKVNHKIQIGTGIFLLLLLGFLFVPECDDCYFAFWRYDSFKDFLITQPSHDYGLLVGIPENGRYLGNILGVLLSKVYFTQFCFVHGLIMTAGFSLLIYGLAKSMHNDRISWMEALSLSFAIFIFAPRGIHQEVYSWGAAWVNYLLPMIGVLFLFQWPDSAQSKKHVWPVLFVSFACCLFIEPITILLAGFAFVATAASYNGYLPKKQAIAFCIGSWVGAFIMFTAPGYFHGTNESRVVSLSLIAKNLPVIFTQTFQRPAILAAVISFLFVWLLHRQGNHRWKFFMFVLVPMHVFLFILYLRDLFYTTEHYNRYGIAISFILPVLWVTMLMLWRNGKEKRSCFIVILAMFLLNGPLLIVSPIAPRNFFPSYLCLTMIAIFLYQAARAQGLGSFEKIRYIAAAAAICLIFVYACNFFVYHHRLKDAQSQVACGATEVTLPLVPFPGWTVNEYRGKGDLSYIIYRQTPWDVDLEFVPYGTNK